MFDSTAQNVIVLLTTSFLWFHFGRSIGIRIGYLKGRKAVREYYENKDKVRV